MAKGTINAASIMVLLILGSIPIWGRGFCGWACHMRGAIEFADWMLRKLQIGRYLALREEYSSTPSPLAENRGPFVPPLPVIILIHNVNSGCKST